MPEANQQSPFLTNSLRWGLLLLGAVATIFSALQMWQRYQEDELWLYWPIPLLLFAWLTWRMIRYKANSREPNHDRWLLLSTLSGFLLYLGFPVLPLPFLLFVGFVPLLLVEHEISERYEGISSALVFRYAYHAFIIWNLFTTYWVVNTALAAGIVAITVNSFLMCLPFYAYHLCKKILNERLALLGFIVFWISFEYGHLQWEISWPWLTLGNGFASFPSWVQWYEFTGVFGGTLWILLANLLFFRAYLLGKNSAEAKAKLGYAAGLILLPITISMGMYWSYEEQGKAVEVVVAQPNYEPHYQKFKVNQSDQIRHFCDLSAQALTDSTEYLVFPETSFGRIKRDEMFSNRAIRQLQTFINDYPRLKLVTGIGAMKIFEKGEPLTDAIRTHVRSNGDTLHWESYNAATQLTSGQREAPIYLKSKLVPGAEIFPYRHALFFLKPLVESLDGADALGIQKERSVFKSDVGAVAPVICYESIYGEYSTGYIRKGANALFIVTNDGWWDNTAGHKQHLVFASLRAIETRRSIARSANTGVSGFINQRGEILGTTQYDEPIALRGTIYFNQAITFYVRWGDLIARLAIFTTALLLLNMIAKGWMKRVAA